ncbi:hypothetical protein OK016_15050 [Vibrio chagasii]|nr:hypothetical protein [Vibrio chagasii]
MRAEPFRLRSGIARKRWKCCVRMRGYSLRNPSGMVTEALIESTHPLKPLVYVTFPSTWS